MGKTINRFIIDDSGRGKFPLPVVIHTQTPKFAAQILIMSAEAFGELECRLSNQPMYEIAYASKKLTTGKYLVIQTLDVWDYIPTDDTKDMVTALKLGVNAYYSYTMDKIREAGVNSEELEDCLEFINISILNSERTYYEERHNHTEEHALIFRQNVTIAKWIRKYLRKLQDINLKVAGRL